MTEITDPTGNDVFKPLRERCLLGHIWSRMGLSTMDILREVKGTGYRLDSESLVFGGGGGGSGALVMVSMGLK